MFFSGISCTYGWDWYFFPTKVCRVAARTVWELLSVLKLSRKWLDYGGSMLLADSKGQTGQYYAIVSIVPNYCIYLLKSTYRLLFSTFDYFKYATPWASIYFTTDNAEWSFLRYVTECDTVRWRALAMMNASHLQTLKNGQINPTNVPS